MSDKDEALKPFEGFDVSITLSATEWLLVAAGLTILDQITPDSETKEMLASANNHIKSMVVMEKGLRTLEERDIGWSEE